MAGMNHNEERAKAAGGVAIYCGLATGFAGWLLAVLALADESNWEGAALALAASALAFGLMANAVFRQ